MKPSDFVDAMKVAVHEDAIAGVLASLHKPSGRSPAPNLIEVSRWFNGLPEEDQDEVRKLIALSVHSAVFGFFCVLDGVRAVEDEKGEVVLDFHDIHGESQRLNDPTEEMLHDLYQSAVYDDVFGKRR